MQCLRYQKDKRCGRESRAYPGPEKRPGTGWDLSEISK
jgi:hypothetical protein